MSAEEQTHANLRESVPLTYRPLVAAFSRLRHGELTLRLPEGQEFRFAGSRPGPHAVWVINRRRTVRRMLVGGLIGFAEAYMDGDWDAPDLVALIELGEMNRELLGGLDGGGWLSRALQWAVHKLRRNSRRGSRRNIAYHYDLGNEFYKLWLDETMTYSSALFADAQQSLADAQRNKYQHILQRLDLGPGDHLLEIGSGWGGFAIYAAKTTGCRVTSITLSEEQLVEARSRAADEGLSDRVEFRLQDYRDTEGTFDAISSIEMFEAVGEVYWPSYFATVKQRLKPGGRAALQVITIRDDLFHDYRKGVDFIQRYIFPGGMLPSPAEFSRQARIAGLAPTMRSFHGDDYATTLRHWDRRFSLQRARISEQGFDERFCRMWHYYLAYCEAGFRRGTIDLMQIALVHDGEKT